MTRDLLFHGVMRGPDAPVPDTPPHERVERQGLTALVSDAPDALHDDTSTRREELVQAVVDHDRLLAAYAASRDIIPLRFGTTVASIDAAGALLLANLDALCGALRKTAGCAEVALRVARSTGLERRPQRQHPTDGRSFLRRKAAEQEARGRARTFASAEAVHALLDPLCRQAVRALDVKPSNGRLTDRRLLLKREDYSGLLAACRASGAAFAATGLRLSLCGPWPPYSFATYELEVRT